MDKSIRYITDYQRVQYEFGKGYRFGPLQTPVYIDGVEIILRLARDHPIEDIFLDDVHPSALTNRAIADELVQKIDPWLRKLIGQ